MFGPLAKGIGLAASPTGRRAIRGAVRFARSEEGRKVVDQALRAAKYAGKSAKSPENRQRVDAAIRLLRSRGR